MQLIDFIISSLLVITLLSLQTKLITGQSDVTEDAEPEYENSTQLAPTAEPESKGPQAPSRTQNCDKMSCYPGLCMPIPGHNYLCFCLDKSWQNFDCNPDGGNMKPRPSPNTTLITMEPPMNPYPCYETSCDDGLCIERESMSYICFCRDKSWQESTCKEGGGDAMGFLSGSNWTKSSTGLSGLVFIALVLSLLPVL